MGRSVDDQVAAVRREVQQIAMRMDSMRARDGVSGQSAQCRLARIQNTPANGDNTFDIVFLDGSYLKVAGQQSPYWVPRQYSARTVAYNLTNQKLGQNTVVLAVYWSRHWWIERVVSTGDTPDDTPGEARWYKPSFYSWATPGTPINEYLWRDGPTRNGVTFGLKTGSDIPITHDKTDLNFTSGQGNFTVNETGSYEITTSFWWRLARDSSGAAAPPATTDPFGVYVGALGAKTFSFLESITWSHNAASGWGVSDTIYFTWQPNYLMTYVRWRNFTAGDRFSVTVSVGNIIPGGYGISCEDLVIKIRHLGAQHAEI